MEISLTDGIAGLALLVSLLACISASKSANHAESSAESAIIANRLAQHNERLAIYKSLQKFNFELLTKGNTLQDSALWQFSDAVNISEFYYPQTEAKALEEIANVANRYLAMRDHWKAKQENGEFPEAQAALKELNAQSKALREKCAACDGSLRQHLRLEAPHDDRGD